jgi:hypothetical protein
MVHDLSCFRFPRTRTSYQKQFMNRSLKSWVFFALVLFPYLSPSLKSAGLELRSDNDYLRIEIVEHERTRFRFVDSATESRLDQTHRDVTSHIFTADEIKARLKRFYEIYREGQGTVDPTVVGALGLAGFGLFTAIVPNNPVSGYIFLAGVGLIPITFVFDLWRFHQADKHNPMKPNWEGVYTSCSALNEHCVQAKAQDAGIQQASFDVLDSLRVLLSSPLFKRPDFENVSLDDLLAHGESFSRCDLALAN